jgi:hypothetical protein
MKMPRHAINGMAITAPFCLQKHSCLVYFCKGSNASANALPIWANIFALPK